MMTKEKLLEALGLCAADDDTENAHARADDALLDFIDDDDVRKAYEKVPKWYA